MAVLQKVTALKHFQYKKALRIPGEQLSVTPEDAKALIGNGKAEPFKEPVKEKQVKPAE